MMRTLAAALAVLAACASSDGTADGPPTLTLTSPARGTSADGTTVMVTGTVKDESPGVRVMVNGHDATIAKDGSFTANVDVDPGITVIETHAIDKTGHDVRDVRAVLAGTVAQSDGTKASPVGAHASPAAIKAIAGAVAASANAIDYTAEVQKANPLYNDGDCNGAVVNVTSVNIGDVKVGLTPQTGALAANVELDTVAVHLHVHYRVVCIGGDADVTIRASAAHVDGDLGVQIASGKVATTLSGTSVRLDGFDLNVSGLPDFVVNLFNGTVRSRVESALQSTIQSKVPPIANTTLSGLLAKPFDTSLLGHDAKLTVTPTDAKLTTSGIYLGVTAKVLVTGGTGGMYVEQDPPDADSLMGQTRNLGLAVANDLVNQLLAGLWAAGAFDQSLAIKDLSVVAALLDPDATTLDVKMSLPPTLQSDGTGNLQLALGDAMITVKNTSGTPLQQIALSVKTSVSMSASSAGEMSLALGNPTVYAQVLEQVDDGSRPLTDMQVEGIVTGAWSIISDQASTALSKLPMPKIAGVQLGAPEVQSVSNYLLADIPLQ